MDIDKWVYDTIWFQLLSDNTLPTKKFMTSFVIDLKGNLEIKNILS